MSVSQCVVVSHTCSLIPHHIPTRHTSTQTERAAAQNQHQQEVLQDGVYVHVEEGMTLFVPCRGEGTTISTVSQLIASAQKMVSERDGRSPRIETLSSEAQTVCGDDDTVSVNAVYVARVTQWQVVGLVACFDKLVESGSSPYSPSLSIAGRHSVDYARQCLVTASQTGLLRVDGGIVSAAALPLLFGALREERCVYVSEWFVV